MRFLDANIFIYAYYKPKRQLTKREETMKNSAKRIIENVNEGKEKVITTVVHLSEMVNILKQGLSLDELYETVFGLLTLDSVKMIGVSKEDYLAATELGMELRLDPNDALAVQVMKSREIAEIYSFDKGFERVKEIVRLPSVT